MDDEGPRGQCFYNHQPGLSDLSPFCLSQDPRLPPHVSSYSSYCPTRPPPPLHQQPRPPSDLTEARCQRSPAEVIPAPPPLHVPYDHRRPRIPPQKTSRTDVSPVSGFPVNPFSSQVRSWPSLRSVNIILKVYLLSLSLFFFFCHLAF